MAKSSNDGTAFGEELMDVFNITDPRKGVGGGGMMIGRGINGEPGVQIMGHFVPFSKFKESGSGSAGAGDDSGTGGKKDAPEDIDFPVKTRSRSLADTYRPKVKPTMNEGGLVRGAGKAQRGHGRGKMV
jgi:hypothetical protein